MKNWRLFFVCFDFLFKYAMVLSSIENVFEHFFVLHLEIFTKNIVFTWLQSFKTWIWNLGIWTLPITYGVCLFSSVCNLLIFFYVLFCFQSMALAISSIRNCNHQCSKRIVEFICGLLKFNDNRFNQVCFHNFVICLCSRLRIDWLI